MNTLPDVVQSQDSVLAIIERAANNPEVSPEKMHSLLDLQIRIMDKQAEVAFNQAFALASKEMPRVEKRGVIDMGAKGKIAFAKYEDLDAVLRPIEERFGFTRSFLTTPAPSGIEMTVRLTHAAGHTISSTRFMPPDTGAGRNSMQAIGSASSYAKRYLTLDIWNIVTVGADDNAMASEAITESQIKALEALLEETGTKLDKFLSHFNVATLSEMQQRDYKEAEALLNQKRRQKK